jgi:hypothetical protein
VAVAVGVGEAGDPVGGGGEQDPVPGLAGLDGQAGGDMCLAGSGRSEQDDVAGFGEERAGAQGGDLLPDGGLGVEVEVLEGLDRGKPGSPDAEPGAGGAAG